VGERKRALPRHREIRRGAEPAELLPLGFPAPDQGIGLGQGHAGQDRRASLGDAGAPRDAEEEDEDERGKPRAAPASHYCFRPSRF
jgi:hypothetical protein